MDLLIIGGLGKAFYDLANDFEKNKWLFAIIGVISFYIFTFFVGVSSAIVFSTNGDFSESTITMLGYFATIISLIFSLILYVILKKRWETDRRTKKTGLLDDNLIA